MTGRDAACEGERAGRRMAGLFLIGLGTLLFLRTLGVLDAQVLRWLGPAVLVGFGLFKLTRRGRRPAGIWLLGLGVLLGLHKADLLALSVAWPYVMVVAGLALLASAFDPRRDSARREE